jgi:hypothetical protein
LQRQLADADLTTRAFHTNKDSQLRTRDMWLGVSRKILYGLHSLGGYMAKLPGFVDLCPTDRHVLLRNTFFSVGFIFLAHMCVAGELNMCLPGGLGLTRAWVLRLMGATLGQRILNFMQQISELAMTEFELGLIVPAILTSRLGKF